jgi:hypothetical protein
MLVCASVCLRVVRIEEHASRPMPSALPCLPGPFHGTFYFFFFFFFFFFFLSAGPAFLSSRSVGGG